MLHPQRTVQAFSYPFFSGQSSLMDITLNIAITTAYPAVADRLLSSIKNKLPTLPINFFILHIGHNPIETPHSWSEKFTYIAQTKDYLSILQSRNLCQDFLKKRGHASSDIAILLDDDLVWTMPELKFRSLVAELKSTQCDMAFSSLHGDPPIPKEYTRASPLLDLLISIDKQHTPKNKEIQEFINSVSIQKKHLFKKIEKHAHHDNYAFNKNNFNPKKINTHKINWVDFILKLHNGKTTTRPISTPKKIEQATGLDRGGATFIFNPVVLTHKNSSIKILNWVSRRSDMMMAIEAEKTGHKLYLTPPILSHEREESFDSHKTKKLIEDIFGVALISSNGKKEQFIKYFHKRIAKINFILEQSNRMLHLLDQWLRKHNKHNKTTKHTLKTMQQENRATLHELKKNK
ncbi:MAG: hypothetical protein Q9O24_06410 [Gammaproteobacteria bacterium]|nr:hypothetical protein [Gammaproteobacteria bacterium]